MKKPILVTYRILVAVAFAAMPMLAVAQVRAIDDYAHTTVNAAAVSTKVLSNDRTTTGVLKIDKIPLSNNGSANISADGTEIIFKPAKDFKGVALVNYTITDGLGHFDCALLTIDVSPSPLPVDQTIKLFTRPGEKITFTVPKGMSVSQNAQGDANWINGDGSGVYFYQPRRNVTEPSTFTFDKNENGTQKTYYVEVNVIGSPVSEFLKDDYVYLPINSNKTINVQLNDSLIKPIATISSGNASSSDCQVISWGGGSFQIIPNTNFKGTFNFDYTVNYTDGTSETATVHATIANYEPVSDRFEITAYQGIPYEFKYNNPIAGGQWTFMNRNGGLSRAGGEVGFNSKNEIVYIPPTSGDADNFEVEYCVTGGGCKIVKINVILQPATPSVCATNCVFPGDANRDGLVDMWDLLTVGSAIGQYGSARSDANLAWMPTSATDWKQTLANGVNTKNVDLNGDGIISALDTGAIVANYGKVNSIIAERTPEATKVELQVLTTSNAAAQGDMIEITVSVGSASMPVVDVQGLTYSVGYDADMIQENTLSVEYLLSNWLSRYDAYIAMSKLVNRGRIETGIVRSQDRGVSGHGEVSKIRAVVIDDPTGFNIGTNPALRFRINDVYLMDGNGRMLQVKGKDITIPIKVAKKDAPLVETDLLMFPNPSSDFMSFYLNGVNNIESLRVLDMMGKEINRQSNINSKQATVYFDNYTPGMYIAEVMTAKGKIVKKIQVVK